MKLILHHFWKDVCLLRWLLGLWLLLAVLELGLIYLSVTADYKLATTADVTLASPLLYVASAITWMLLIIRLVQTEPVTGSTSFWRTRPVPTWVSVPSKLFFILALVVLPSLLLSIVELSLFGLESSAVREHGWTLLFLESAVAVTVVWLATYTRNLVQIWAVLALLFVCSIVFSVVFAYRVIGSPMTPTRPDLLMTRSFLMVTTFLGGLVLSLVVQYGWRRTRLAFVIGIVGIVLGVGSAWWPVAFRVPHGRGQAPSSSETRINYTPPNLKSVIWTPSPFSPGAKTGTIFVTPPAGNSTVPVLASASLSFQALNSNPAQLDTSPDLYSTNQLGQIEWSPELSRQNPDLSMNAGAATGWLQRVEITVGPSQMDLRNSTGVLHVALHGDLVTLKKCAELPLGAPGFRRLHGMILRMPAAEKQGSDVIIHLRVVGYDNEELSRGGNFPLVYLVVDTKDRIGLKLFTTFAGMNTQTNFGTWGRRTEENTMETNPNILTPDKRAALEAQSIDNFVLQVYEIVPSGKFVSDVTVPNFKMDWQ